MRQELATLRKIFASRSVRWGALVAFSALFVVVRSLPHIALYKQFLGLPGIALTRYGEVFFEYSIASFAMAPLYEQFISIALPLLVVVNAIVAYRYYRRVTTRAGGVTIASVGGIFLGLFGVGCFACSGLLLAPLLALFGLTGVVALLPFRGLEIGFFGIAVLALSTFFLLRALARPQTCRVSARR